VRLLIIALALLLTACAAPAGPQSDAGAQSIPAAAPHAPDAGFDALSRLTRV
jgi:PBP1b-binding outer membrane lipoprotein LpoB